MNQFAYLMPDNKSIGTFNIDKVIRSVPIGQGRLVLLDDGHEESIVVEYETEKSGKIKVDSEGSPIPKKRERRWMDSQIELNKADSERFLSIIYDLPEIPEAEPTVSEPGMGPDNAGNGTPLNV